MLQLRFSTQAGRVELSCDPGSARDLQALRGRFTSGASISSQAFDLEIDDLLVNLHELAHWPTDGSDDDVRWQPELLTLVEGNAADAAVLQARLAEDSTHTAPPAAPPAGGGWAAALTDFQRRDLGKLLQLAHGANFSVPGAGKTRVSLAAFQSRRDAGQVSRMLVVCPKSAFESWQAEAATCFPGTGLRTAIMDTATPPACDILLVNYERLPDARPALLQWLRAAATLLLLSFFDEIPRELDDAAMVDGASRFGAFRGVVLHYVRGGLAATAVLAFIFSWNEFLLTLVLTTGIIRTVPVASSTFTTAFTTEYGYLAALGTASVVPIFVFILLVQRHLVRGLTLGAVK